MTKAWASVFVFMILVSAMPPSIACGYCPPPSHGSGQHPPKGGGGHHGGGGSPPKTPKPPTGQTPKPPTGHVPSPKTPKPPVVIPPPSGGGGYPPYVPKPPSGGSPVVPTPSIPTPSVPTPTIPTPSNQYCPKDALKLGACVDLLGGLVHVIIGDPVVNQCCPIIQGLAALEAALCLCTVIRAKVLNLNVYLPLALELLATCGVTPPPGFKCPEAT